VGASFLIIVNIFYKKIAVKFKGPTNLNLNLAVKYFRGPKFSLFGKERKKQAA